MVMRVGNLIAATLVVQTRACQEPGHKPCCRYTDGKQPALPGGARRPRAAERTRGSDSRYTLRSRR